MPIPEVPDSAPFTAEQRAWLNGFLSAWASMEERSGRSLPSDISDIKQAATAAGFKSVNAAAKRPATAAVTAAVAEPVAVAAAGDAGDPFDGDYPWHDSSMDIDERLKLADNQPQKFKLMAAMAQLDCGACGYMCDTYAAAIDSGEEKNLLLCSPGGKETAKTLKTIVREHKKAGNANQPANSQPAAGSSFIAEPTTAAARPSVELFSRARPIRGKLRVSRNLNQLGSAKHTQHLELYLAHDDVGYQVGDSLGVFPTNDPHLVEQILEVLRSHGTEPVVSPDGIEEPLRKALTARTNLSQIDDDVVELVMASTGDDDERKALQALLDDDDRMHDTDLLELLRLAPTASVSSRKLAKTLSPLAPRLYSIASSLKAHPGMVHLTVARVAYEVRGRSRLGVASTMLTDRLAVGDTVKVYRHKSHGFTIPDDHGTPMIMVGPGTGVAPFRAFLQERQATGAKGKNWLFFGDQHEATDFLYADEFAQMQESGLLTKLSTAFSRDQDEKVYVQDRMLEESTELYRWLEEGAVFYVCGDASRMAGDVDRALHRVIEKEAGLSEEAARAYVSVLKKENRYQRDVY